MASKAPPSSNAKRPASASQGIPHPQSDVLLVYAHCCESQAVTPLLPRLSTRVR
jgi:hypothetical protein